MSAAVQSAVPQQVPALAAAPAPAGLAPLPRPTTTALYVGDLNPDVSEANLFEHFSVIGTVASIRVCRDAITRRSLGYAYVNFQNASDAERAIDTLNFSPIFDRPCRISWCQRDPTLRRSGLGNIFIMGLDKSIDNKELHDAFSVFGTIISCKLVLDEHGNRVGRGFVHFQRPEDAQKAIATANKTMLKDHMITVSAFKSRKERLEEYAKAEHTFKNVYVKNLAEDITNDELLTLFQPFGSITSHIVMTGKDGDASKSKGFGFVNFAEFEQAKKAVETLNGVEYKGKNLFVGRAMKKSERRNILAGESERRRRELQERTKGVNLYIKNLGEGVTNDGLRGLFAEFGPISSARVMIDEAGVSRGFGFVCFQEQADATRAVSEMNGRLTDGKPLYVALAQSKDERRQTLAQLHRQRVQAQRTNMAPYMAAPNMFQQQMYPNFGAPYAPRGYPQFNNPGFNQPMGGHFPQAQGQYMGQPGYGRPQQAYRQSRPGANRMGGAPNRGPRQQYNQQQPQYAQQAQMGVPQQQVAPPPTSNVQQLAALLASSEPDRQKQILGDNLYQLISSFYPEHAGKLTGMLLQMDNSDLLHLIEDPVSLRAEVDKAYVVLVNAPAQ